MKLTVAALVLGLAATANSDHPDYVYPPTIGGGNPRSVNSMGDDHVKTNPILVDSAGTEPFGSDLWEGNVGRGQAQGEATHNQSSTGTGNATGGAVNNPVGMDQEDEEDDEDDAPSVKAFGLEGLTTFLSRLRHAEWKWPRVLLQPHIPEPTTAAVFTDVVCTTRHVDPADVRRAARHLEHFCNRYGVNDEGLYASTADTSTIYMCSYTGKHVCSIRLWNEANEHLDRACGVGGTGYLHVDGALNGMRIGREVVRGWTLCQGINNNALHVFNLRQKDALANGKPYMEWVAEHKIQRAMDATRPRTINDKGNDEDP